MYYYQVMVLLLLFASVHFCSVFAYTDTELLAKFKQNDYKMKFERCELGNYSREVFKSYKLTTFKYNRTNAAVNLTYTMLKDTSDMQILAEQFKFISNEYRRFPLHIQLNYCKVIKANAGGILDLSRCGNSTITCEWKKGVTYHYCNFSPDQNKLPPMFPSGSYKLRLFIMFEQKVIVHMDCYTKVFRDLE